MNRTIHVTFSPSGAGSLRPALRAAGRRERVIAFPDDLGYGPIDPPDPEVRLQWIIRELGFRSKDWDWLPDAVRKFWEEAEQPETERLVWMSRSRVTEYSAFLELV
jgi:hypothetical protein